MRLLEGFKIMNKVKQVKNEKTIIKVTLIPLDYEYNIHFVVDMNGNISEYRSDKIIRFNGGWFRYINEEIVE